MIYSGVNSASTAQMFGQSIQEVADNNPGLAIPSNRTVTVNGQTVNESTYVISEGDEVWIFVEKGVQGAK